MKRQIFRNLFIAGQKKGGLTFEKGLPRSEKRMQKRSGSFLESGCPSATAENYAGPDHEPEIIPSAVVVDLVEIDPVGEKADDKCEWGDETVPQSLQESCSVPEFTGYTL
jgi:hypothetical protein